MMNPEMIDALLNWYEANRRDLPWRRTQDPYAIWLSEVMLQQTQVDTVIPYYHKFMSRYPTVESLANAETDHVLKLWEGLGYYSRAKRLIACARQVLDQHGGQFPTTREQMLKLPGVGSYTAGAVLGIAYNQKVPAVDGNVLRVMSRLLAWDLDIGNPKNRQVYEDYLTPRLPENMRSFNQAMMELGAVICSPKSPKCTACPVSNYCQAFNTDRVLNFPVKTKKKPSPQKQVVVLALKAYTGEYLLFQKEPEGLLGGFWALPYGLGDTLQEATSDLVQWLENKMPQVAQAVTPPLVQHVLTDPEFPTRVPIKHVFTHQTWLMHLVELELPLELSMASKATTASLVAEATAPYALIAESKVKSDWLNFKQMKGVPITTAMKKNINGLGVKVKS